MLLLVIRVTPRVTVYISPGQPKIGSYSKNDKEMAPGHQSSVHIWKSDAHVLHRPELSNTLSLWKTVMSVQSIKETHIQAWSLVRVTVTL